jgi:hypothetical protein
MPPTDDFAEQFHRRQIRAQQDRQRRSKEFLLHGLGTEYAETKNPLCVWGAWRLCSGSNIPLPDWALAYFDNLANHLQQWVERPPPGRLADAVGTELGFNFSKKDGNPLTDWRERLEGERWFAIFEAYLCQGLSPTAACKQVAQDVGSTNPTVHRRLRRFAKNLSR